MKNSAVAFSIQLLLTQQRNFKVQMNVKFQTFISGKPSGGKKVRDGTAVPQHQAPRQLERRSRPELNRSKSSDGFGIPMLNLQFCTFLSKLQSATNTAPRPPSQ